MNNNASHPVMVYSKTYCPYAPLPHPFLCCIRWAGVTSIRLTVRSCVCENYLLTRVYACIAIYPNELLWYVGPYHRI
jgi:hypothetical protein